MKLKTILAFAACLVLSAVAHSTSKPTDPAKAEDDFQLVKVAEGVYAAIAKPGGVLFFVESAAMFNTE